MIKTWTGKVQLYGEATRGGDPDPGEEVEARIALDGERVTVERNAGLDGVGTVRWMPLRPSEIKPESLCKALVESTPDRLL